MEALRREWIDTYRAVHPDHPGFTCCIDDVTQAPGEPLQKRIDYLFLVPGTDQAARVISSQRVLDRPFPAARGWQRALDHVGLLAVIEIER
jgi:exonuclease III